MSNLKFRYYMKLSFDDAVSKHRFSLKCIPQSDDKQVITLDVKSIYPNSFISDGRDSFGNLIVYGYEETEHKCFFFDIRGEALCGKDGFNSLQNVRIINSQYESLLRYPTEQTWVGNKLNEYSDNLREYFKKVADSSVYEFADYYYRDFIGDGVLSEDARYAIYVMERINRDYSYQRGITNLGTSAEEAFGMGAGVCQDYSHIMLAMLRHSGIPCRYITGMMKGEGESHAWVEVFTNGFWLPLDPTNNLVVTDQHIKIAHGRDYKDCLVNRGVFVGDTVQHQEITVTVEDKHGG